MKKINSYSKEGKKMESIKTPSLWEKEYSPSLLAQAIHVYQDRQHPGNKAVKTRANVNMTKKKVYKQKGTGGARHGAQSAPIFVGGGIAHGPKPVKKVLQLSQALKKASLYAALSWKVDEGKVISSDGVESFTKTKQVSEFLKSLSTDFKTNNVLFVLKSPSALVFRNLTSVRVATFESLNAYQVFISGLIVFEQSLLMKDSPVSAKTKKTKAKLTNPKTKK